MGETHDTPRVRTRDALALCRDAARFGRDAAWELCARLRADSLALMEGAGLGWRGQAAALLGAGFASAARLGLGRDPSTPEEAAFLAAGAAAADALLATFAEGDDAAVPAGGLPLACWAVYSAFERRRMASAGAAWERRVPGRGCCGGCLGLAAFGWRPAGELPGPGEGPCSCRCSCRFAYESGPRPRRPGVAEAVSLPAVMGLEGAHEWCEANGFAHGRALKEGGRLVFMQFDAPPGMHPEGPPGSSGEGVVTVPVDAARGVEAAVRLSDGEARFRFWGCGELGDWSPGELAGLEPHEAAWALESCELDEGTEAVLRSIVAGEAARWDAVRGVSHVRHEGSTLAGQDRAVKGWGTQVKSAASVWAGIDSGRSGYGGNEPGPGPRHGPPAARAAWTGVNPGGGGYDGGFASPGNSVWAGFSGPGGPDAWDMMAAGAAGTLSHVLAGHAHGLDGQDILPFPQGSDPDANPHLAAASRMVRAARMNEADTRRAWSGADGYHPMRAALHERLAASALNPFAAAAAGGKPQAVLAIGNHCAGKSTQGLAAAGGAAPAWTVASSNDLMERLPEYQGWNAPLLHSEAEDVAALAMKMAVARRHHVFVEHVGHDLEEAWALAGRLGDAGYDIHLVHADVPPAEAAARAAGRFLDNPFGLASRHEPSARYVPPEYVADDVGGRPAATYLELRDHPAVATWRSYDASGGPGSVPKLRDHGSR